MSCNTCIHFIVCDAHRIHNGIGMKLCGLYTDKGKYIKFPDFTKLSMAIRDMKEKVDKLSNPLDIENLESEIYKE